MPAASRRHSISTSACFRPSTSAKSINCPCDAHVSLPERDRIPYADCEPRQPRSIPCSHFDRRATAASHCDCLELHELLDTAFLDCFFFPRIGARRARWPQRAQNHHSLKGDRVLRRRLSKRAPRVQVQATSPCPTNTDSSRTYGAYKRNMDAIQPGKTRIEYRASS